MDWQLFFTLIAGHYLADFGLQLPYMAEKKAKAFVEPIGFHVLTAHAAIHGLVAGVISGHFWVGVFVAVTHWIIDFGKASDLIDNRFPHTAGARRNGQTHGMYGIHLDQTLHILVLLVATGLVS